MMDFKNLLDNQRRFFAGGQTKNVSFRRHQLAILQHAIEQNETRILDALARDLGKTHFEGYLTEVGLVLDEIRYAIKRIARWARPERVRTRFLHFPGVSTLHPEPYGLALIISPWNYPFMLAVSPLIGAIAAGNCAVVKPSEFSPATSDLVAEIFTRYFDPGHVAVVTGDAAVSQALLAEKFDSIFFTGSPGVARYVMAAAAEHLTPVTLELGGKSPAIVAPDARIDSTARKIASGKVINAGQTCIAPDYVLVHHSVKEALIERIKAHLLAFFGENPQDSPDYPRIVNHRHFDRIARLMVGADIVWGGQTDRGSLYIAPTLADNVAPDHPLMQEEIFGPILPVIAFDDLNDAVETVRTRPKPLSLYLFTQNEQVEKRIMGELSFGGGCINDTLVHFASPYLPFGGVGASGIGSYHGKASFDAFTHRKSVLKNLSPIDNPFRFPPYMKSLGLIKKVLR